MNVNEMLSCVVAAVLFLLVSFILYWDLWKYEEPEDNQELQAREREDEE